MENTGKNKRRLQNLNGDKNEAYPRIVQKQRTKVLYVRTRVKRC
jgi:hypothetical protein